MAGLVEILLGKDNPVTQWTGRNSNLLTGLGTSLLSDGMNFQPAQVGATLDRQAAAQKEADAKLAANVNATKTWLQNTYPDLAQAVDAGLPISDAWQEAFKRRQGAGDPFTLNPGDTRFNADGSVLAAVPGTGLDANGAARFQSGFTPINGTYKGKPAVAFPGNDARLYIDGKPVDQNDFTPTNPYDLNAQRGAGTAFGRATGGTQFTLPQAENELAQSEAAIAKLSEPDVLKGKDEWFGQAGAVPRGMWVQGGSNMAKFQNTANNIIDRSWLSARAILKGAGQVTDYEGAKAENAVSMMKAALDKGDKASYDTAVQEYQYWIQQGFAKVKEQAAAMAGYGASGGGQGIPTVSDQAGYNALPSGSQYIAPDGTTRTKP